MSISHSFGPLLTDSEQSYRTIAYQIANSMAAIIGPLLSYGVGRAAVTATSVKQYQVIFFAMGALSLFLAPIVWFLMPNSPTTAKFLRNGDDRIIALDRLKENNTGTKSSTFKWSQVWETYRDIKVSGGYSAAGARLTGRHGLGLQCGSVRRALQAVSALSVVSSRRALALVRPSSLHF